MFWDDTFTFEWCCDDHTRPKYGHIIRNEVRHPECDATVGHLSWDASAVPSWWESADGFLAEIAPSGSIERLWYRYRTKYDHPGYGLVELNPEIEDWVALPAAAYSVELVGRVAWLWRWEDVDPEYAPPNGAGSVLTRQQPNDTPVPIQVVPWEALPESVNRFDAITPPDDAMPGEPCSAGSFSPDTDLTERMATVYDCIQRSYANAMYKTDLRLFAGSTEIVIDSVRQVFTDLTGPGRGLVVAAVTHDYLLLHPYSLQRPQSSNPHYSLSNERAGFDIEVATVAVATEPQHLYDIDKPAALFRENIDHTQFAPGDVLTTSLADETAAASPPIDALREATWPVTSHDLQCTLNDILRDHPLDTPVDSDDARALLNAYEVVPPLLESLPDDLETLDDAEAAIKRLDADRPWENAENTVTLTLSYAPAYTGLLRHQLPEFAVDGHSPHPDRYVDTVPHTHEVIAVKPESEPRAVFEDGAAYVVRPPGTEVDPDRGYQLWCHRYELPPNTNVFAVTYEEPNHPGDDTRRFTRARSDPPLTKREQTVLRAIVDVGGELKSAEIPTTLGLDYHPHGALTLLSQRKFITHHRGNDMLTLIYSVTEDGRTALDSTSS